MENTVESILAHGGKDPQLLLDNLKNGGSNSTSLDEELARQLSSEVDSGVAPSTSRSAPSTNNTTSTASTTSNQQQRLRGTPTTLPDDFLRVNSQATMDSDEALARMLQDKLWRSILRR